MARRCAQNTVASIPIYLAIVTGVVGVGSLYAGEEVIILGKGKIQTLVEWNKPVHFGTGSWKVVGSGR